MISARLASSNDDRALLELRALARELVGAQRGGPALLDDLAAEERDAPTTVDFVGELDGVVVGYATTVNLDQRTRLRELFVHPEAREVGVGHHLFAAAVEHARASGAVRLDASALPGDRSTKNFFESHDMKSRLLVVSKQL